VFPQLGLVRVSNCPIKSKELLRQARYRRDMQSFNWQLSETVKNIRKYKHKHFVFSRLFNVLMNKFHIYEPFLRSMILISLEEVQLPRYYVITLKESNYRLKMDILLNNLKMLGYTDIKMNLRLSDFEIEMSFIRSVRFISPYLYELCRDLYEVLSKKNVKYKWMILSSYIRHISPNSTIDGCNAIKNLCHYKKDELYLSHCLRSNNISLEETSLLVGWWERIKHSQKNE
jgi:hypothetical protein